MFEILHTEKYTKTLSGKKFWFRCNSAKEHKTLVFPAYWGLTGMWNAEKKVCSRWNAYYCPYTLLFSSSLPPLSPLPHTHTRRLPSHSKHFLASPLDQTCLVGGAQTTKVCWKHSKATISDIKECLQPVIFRKTPKILFSSEVFIKKKSCWHQ